MSTSAVYNFPNMSFYCHYDNYQSGAALRLFNMVDAMVKPNADEPQCYSEGRGGLAFAFIRGNLDAEPCVNTKRGVEYVYSIFEEDNIWNVRVQRSDYDGKIEYVQVMALEEFINTRIENQGKEDDVLPRVCTVNNPFGHSPNHNLLVVDKDAYEIAVLMQEYSDTFKEGNPNKKSFADKSQHWMKAADVSF